MIIRLTLTTKWKANSSVFFLQLSCFTHTLSHTHTDCSSDEWRRISNVVEAFSLDELGHVRREVLVVSFDVVLQNQTTQRASGLVFSRKDTRERSILERDQEDRHRNVCRGGWGKLEDIKLLPVQFYCWYSWFMMRQHTLRFEACEDKNEIVVEVRKLVKLLQFLQELWRSFIAKSTKHYYAII